MIPILYTENKQYWEVETEGYIFFYGGVFSQWYPSPFTVEDKTFNCAEQYMMYMKAKCFKDDLAATLIMEAKNPAEQKHLGRLVQNYKKSEWSRRRYQIVLEGNGAKFSQNPELFDILKLSENKIIVEASPVDSIWGIGLDTSNSDIFNPDLWMGKNLLGLAIMEARQIIT